MLNSIGLANPGRERFLAEVLPTAARARRATLDLGRRLRRGGVRRDVRRARRRGRDRAQSLVPERRRGARERGGDRRRVPCRDEPAAVREALAGRVGHRRGCACGRGRGRRRALARQHASRARARRADAPADARARHRRLLGTGPETGRAGGRVRLLGRRGPADRGHGRSALGPRRAGADRRRRERGRARNDPLLRPRRTGPDSLRARRRGGRARTSPIRWRRAESPIPPCK